MWLICEVIQSLDLKEILLRFYIYLPYSSGDRRGISLRSLFANQSVESNTEVSVFKAYVQIILHSFHRIWYMIPSPWNFS